MTVYALFLDTVFYDFDTHYDTELLGIYSTEELAKEAMNNLDNEQIQKGMIDEIVGIRIEPYELDGRTNYDKQS